MTTKTIEVSGHNVESAIQTGLAKLGAAREDVTITVLDEGSKGILGIGRREAQVLLSLMAKEPTSIQINDSIYEEPPAQLEEANLEILTDIPTPFDLVEQEWENVAETKQEKVEEILETSSTKTDGESLAEETRVAESVLLNLLKYLHIDAEIESDISEEDDQTKLCVPIFNIKGEELNDLIGIKGETLKSLQFVARLMVAHQLKRRSDFVLDISGYKERRRQALYRLAERMAEKVEKRGKSVTLEPMPSNERRLIHMALRDNKNIFTQSIGEGHGRRVRIMLNKKR